MTNLEIGLGLSLAASVGLQIRAYRKQMILRHLFIQSSDWCARKIDELVASASYEIIQLTKELRQPTAEPVSDEEARGCLPFVILDAKQNWIIQKEAFQADLARNGIPPLDQSDFDDLILNPGWAGFKSGPTPRFIAR